MHRYDEIEISREILNKIRNENILYIDELINKYIKEEEKLKTIKKDIYFFESYLESKRRIKMNDEH